MNLPDRLQEKKTRIMTLLSSPTVPREIREEEEERISTLLRLERRITRPSSLETLLADHIQREYRRQKRGERSRPLCSCRSPGCPLKSGTVPPALRSRSRLFGSSRDSYDKTAEWLQDHNGDGAVLLEALEASDKLRSTYYQLVESIHGRLQRARDVRREELAPSPTVSSTSSSSSEEVGE